MEKSDSTWVGETIKLNMIANVSVVVVALLGNAVATDGVSRDWWNGPWHALRRSGYLKRGNGGDLMVNEFLGSRRSSRTARNLTQMTAAIIEYTRRWRGGNLFDFAQILCDAGRVLFLQPAWLDVGRARRGAIRKFLHVRHIQTGFELNNRLRRAAAIILAVVFI